MSNRLMTIALATIALAVVGLARGSAGEIAVKWKKEGKGYANENRLPPGATVKIRVKSLHDDKTRLEFSVNGERNTANGVGDEFRARVDANGKVLVEWGLGPNQEDAAVIPLEGGGGADLRFGHHKITGVSRWRLVLNVQVVD